MDDYRDKEEIYAECEKLGEVSIRAQVKAASQGGSISFHKRTWLEEKDTERNRLREIEEREQNNRALAAAEKSAAASERAAIAAKESARWTMWAAIVALTAIIMQYFTK